MYGSWWLTSPAVLEVDGGSGVGRDASRYGHFQLHTTNRSRKCSHTAIESFTSVGRLESFSAAAVDEYRG